DGALVLPYCVLTRASTGQLSLRVRRSTTGGESFQEEQILHDYRVEQKVFESSWGFPMMAVDPGSAAFKDRLYLVWAEVSGASTSIMASISKDAGVTWSPPVVVSDLPEPKQDAGSGRRYALLPTVAVNRPGTVAVCWYDASLSSREEFRCDLRIRASVDGGATWLPSVAVTDVSSTYAIGSRGSRLGWLGDTAGLAADSAGAFHPLWIDNRTGVKQVFTASVLVK
ncbi:MAG TPA: sialidase family protein, partial [Chthonomonadaceae bacterium]|nr:sialidase family protein [Chthonomonadaceae bacterium]